MSPALVLIGAGICAALHVAKLPPAIPALQAALGISLVQAGFLLSVVQLCGMAAGVAFGALVDGLGHRRCVLGGLAILAAASALGGVADGVPMLLALRALEGAGFLLVVLSAPALLRTVVPADRLPRVLGVWGAYVPIATGAAFLAGPLVLAALGWRAWWWGLAALTVLVLVVVQRVVPRAAAAGGGSPFAGWGARLAATLSNAGPWCVALAFGCYSAQWLAIVGFLPTIYAQAGWPTWLVATVSAVVAAANALGNIAAGRLLGLGWSPLRLLAIGYGAMAFGALLAFQSALPPPLRVLAVLGFSMLGGVIPATLFTLAVRLAPAPQMVGTTLGWVQQLSASGQFLGPPLVAWVATLQGGWQATGFVTAALAAAGFGFALLLARLLARSPA